MNKLINISLAVQLALVITFLWLSWYADKAMDKSGIGDPAKWESFNNLAGIVFYSFGFLWLSVVFIALLAKSFRSTAAQCAISFPPIVLIFGCILLLLF